MGIDGLSEEYSGNELFADYEDVNGLAKDFVDLKNADWKDGLPDELKENETLKAMESPTDLANKHLELAKTHDDTVRNMPEGRPEKPEDYKFDDWPTDDQGQPIFDEADHNLFKKYAHEAGFNQGHFEAAVRYDLVRIGAKIQEFETKREEAWTQIKAARPGMKDEQIRENINSVCESLGMTELATRIDLQSDPTFVEAMLKIKENISEDVLRMAKNVTGGNKISRAADGTPIMKYPSMRK
jgi:hypothetical protein